MISGNEKKKLGKNIKKNLLSIYDKINRNRTDL